MKKLLLYFTPLSLIVLCSMSIAYGMEITEPTEQSGYEAMILPSKTNLLSSPALLKQVYSDFLDFMPQEIADQIFLLQLKASQSSAELYPCFSENLPPQGHAKIINFIADFSQTRERNALTHACKMFNIYLRKTKVLCACGTTIHEKHPKDLVLIQLCGIAQYLLVANERCFKLVTTYISTEAPMKKLLLYFTSLAFIALCSMPIAYGMEKDFLAGDNKAIDPLVSECWTNNEKILELLPRYLFFANHLHIYSFAKDLNALVQVNRALNRYYSDEERAKRVVRSLAKIDRYTCEYDIARKFCPTGVFQNICIKINYLFNVIEQHKELTENDLHDPWFIDATKYVVYDDQPGATIRTLHVAKRRSTLLAEACREGQLHNVCRLCDRSDITKCPQSLVMEIVRERARTRDKSGTNCLAIAQLLLAKGLNPDFRYWPKNPTPLMIAAHNDDKAFVEILLMHNADPYQIGLSVLLREPAWYSEGDKAEHFKDDPMEDAFAVARGEPKGWLHAMVDEIARTRNM